MDAPELPEGQRLHSAILLLCKRCAADAQARLGASWRDYRSARASVSAGRIRPTRRPLFCPWERLVNAEFVFLALWAHAQDILAKSLC